MTASRWSVNPAIESEWLDSRRKLNKDWTNTLKGVQLKYKEIWADLKEKRIEKANSFIQKHESGNKAVYDYPPFSILNCRFHVLGAA